MIEGFCVVNYASFKRPEKKSIHAQVRRRHNTTFTRHVTSHHKKFPSTSCGAILLCNYTQIEATSTTYVCVQFVLISRNENSIFFARKYVTSPYSIVFL